MLSRGKWGPDVCLDCREELVGFCGTCYMARLELERAKSRQDRQGYVRRVYAEGAARLAYYRSQARQATEAHRARKRKAENQ